MADGVKKESGVSHSLESSEPSNHSLSSLGMASSPEDLENSATSGNSMSENDFNTTPRKRPKMKNDKVCGVCGDRALGYNFNAVTCESCKAFFRRNAFKDTQIHCLFKGNCVVDLRTRRFCPSCRLKKCFDIGMKRDMILDETERKARMAKVISNRAKKVTGPREGPSIKTEPTDADEFRVESSTIGSPSGSESLQSPTGIAPPEPTEQLFQQIPRDQLPTDSRQYRKLCDQEHTMLQDLAVSYETTIATIQELENEKCQKENYKNVNDLVNNSEQCVRQLIKFVKHLDDFRLLCQEDQIAALKACVMKSLLLRSVAFYIMERDAWLTLKGEIPTSILREATGFSSLHNLYVSYCRTLKSIIQNNFTLYGLFQVMIIFSPDGYNITDRQLLADVQDKYVSLLKHYLESEYSFEYAQEYFVAVMSKLAELKTLSERHSRVLLQVNPTKIEPLMLEVLNLK